jgi:hypothetical protein
MPARTIGKNIVTDVTKNGETGSRDFRDIIGSEIVGTVGSAVAFVDEIVQHDHFPFPCDGLTVTW